MPEAIVITPVKNSWNTTIRTVKSVYENPVQFEYFVFNDFSDGETRKNLVEASLKFGFTLIHLEEITQTPSPNYNLVLQMAQELALQKNCPLIIIESDVIIQPDTISRLIEIQKKHQNMGIVGAITTDESGVYNFPYNYEKTKSQETVETQRSLSFCCTLISTDFLKKFDFRELAQNKDWFDVYISKQARKLGYQNYLAKGVEVLHLPHSSRPWKNLKYKNPILYYTKKLFLKRDRI